MDTTDSNNTDPDTDPDVVESGPANDGAQDRNDGEDAAVVVDFDVQSYGDVAVQQLIPAVELAMIAATRSSTPVSVIPTVMHPLLRFKKLPRHGIIQVLDAVNDHEDFRDIVAELIDDDTTNDASKLFLLREDGWGEQLDSLLRTEQQTADEKSESKRTAKLQKRLEQVQQLLQASREENEQMQAQYADLESQFESVTSALRSVQAERDQLRDERKTTIGQLKQTEDLARQRLQRVRELEVREPDTSTQVDSTSEVLALREQLNAYQQQLDAQQLHIDRLRAAISTAVSELHGGLDHDASQTKDQKHTPDANDVTATDIAQLEADQSTQQISEPTPSRRIPFRLQQGLRSDTPEGARRLIAAPHITLIDGYNVTMKGWPQLNQQAQRDALLGASGNVAKQVGGTFWLVFDGVGVGNRPAVSVPLDVRIFFSSEDQEADDLILDLIDDLDNRQPVVVVSSDRRVQDGARARGASVIRSELFLELLGVRADL